MRKIAKLVLWTAAIAVVVWGLSQLIPSEERRVQTRLQRVAELASFTGQEGNISRAAKFESLGGCFTVDTQVNVENAGFGLPVLNGRDEVLGIARMALTSSRGATVQFDDIVVKVAPDKQTASADLTARVTVTGERDFGLQELRFSLKKLEGAWLISRVESLKTFEQ